MNKSLLGGQSLEDFRRIQLHGQAPLPGPLMAGCRSVLVRTRGSVRGVVSCSGSD